MPVQSPPKTAFEKWQDGLSEAPEDARWNAWDCEIRTIVNEYNRHLAGTAGYSPLNWQYIKAMLWVETGADSREWKRKPMQIGVPGDPGVTSFLSGKEGGDLILPSLWKGRLTTGSVRTIPTHNIQAGVGYLLMRMAFFDYRTVPDADVKVYEVNVKPGDSFEKIAKANGSTPDVLRRLNPAASVLRPGQTLKLQKASVAFVITGWRTVSTVSIAQRYNGGGDPNYAKKLDYALNLVRNGKAALCEQ
ncbi:hypothetical protein GCM10027093_12860 [Paraburkholderia jirisanensis]